MKIAITGTIASGKSCVKDYLKSKGYYVFDCDEYNHFLLLKGNEGYNKIKELYPFVFDEDILNKKKLANLIFNDPLIKKNVEEILHPLIINKMIELSNKYNPFFAEVQLLFENNLDIYFDLSWLVITSDEISIKRLTQKGYTKKEAIERINNQMSKEEKKNRADKIIYNSNSLESLYHKIDELLKELS